MKKRGAIGIIRQLCWYNGGIIRACLVHNGGVWLALENVPSLLEIAEDYAAAVADLRRQAAEISRRLREERLTAEERSAIKWLRSRVYAAAHEAREIEHYLRGYYEKV